MSFFKSVVNIFKYPSVMARLLCPKIFWSVTIDPPIVTHFFANVWR